MLNASYSDCEPRERMDLFWMIVGLMAFCMPHLSASAVGTSLAWAGLPYPAELLAVLFVLAVLAASGIPAAWKEHLSTASIVASIALVAFECVCGVVTKGAAGNLVLSFVGEAVHVAAASIWLLHASLGDEARPLKDKAPRVSCALLAASGVAWYIATSAVRLAHPAWNPTIETALWLAAAIWMLPTLMTLWICNLAPSQFALLAAMPFAGALAGNRIWWLVSLFIKMDGVGEVSNAVLLAGAALAVAAYISVATGQLGGSPLAVPEDEVAGSVASHDGTAKGLPPSCSAIPFERLANGNKLSEREREVLACAIKGMNSPEIGEAVGIAAPTARTYLARAYEKLGVSGAQEVIEALRSSIGAPSATPAAEDDALVLSPAIVIVVPTAVILFVSLATGLVPGAYATLAGFALGCVILTVGIVRLRELSSAPYWVSVAALLIASAFALVTVAIALGPEAFLVRRAVLGLVFVAAALALTRHAKAFNAQIPALTCAFTGLVIVCLVPRGIRSQLLIHGPAPLPLAAAMLLVAWLLVRRASHDELAAVASVALEGDARVLAYLNGRGLKELVAQVALLTARDYPLGGIAATLGLSESTVTHYRKRAYDALGVDDKAGLIDLLEKEAGL